jgi:hypothetical protein
VSYYFPIVLYKLKRDVQQKECSTNGQFVSCVSSNGTEPENLWTANCTVECECNLNYNEVLVRIPAKSETDGTITEKV